jgi:CRISPR/Cas system endoribonuclease Cas6 (RAMP superfamily)
VLKALVRVQDHYLSLEEDNENVRKQSRQKDLRFLKELEENVTDKYNHYICLSDNEEHGFLR